MWLKRRAQDIRNLIAASRYYETSVAALAARFWYLGTRRRFSPDEMFLLGLLNPADDQKSTGSLISKEALLSVQNSLNPRNARFLTENKVAFFQRCIDYGLATPKIIALYCKGTEEFQGLTTLRNLGDLRRFLERHVALDIVVKPAGGVHGIGISALSWALPDFVGDSRIRRPEDLVAHMESFPYSTWIIQLCLSAHPDIAALSGSQRLQTIRVVSYVDKASQVSLPIAWLRIISGASVFDNFNFGASGNLVATLDLGTGRLKYVLGASPTGFGLEEIQDHPITGEHFSEFCVPFIEEAAELAKSAAQAFQPLRTVGWDVAISGDGASLIEGNVTWDPLPTRENMSAIADSLRLLSTT